MRIRGYFRSDFSDLNKIWYVTTAPCFGRTYRVSTEKLRNCLSCELDIQTLETGNGWLNFSLDWSDLTQIWSETTATSFCTEFHFKPASVIRATRTHSRLNWSSDWSYKNQIRNGTTTDSIVHIDQIRFQSVQSKHQFRQSSPVECVRHSYLR